MVVGAFPAAKLGVLALKQISKPIANVLKDRAKNNEFFRKYVCMPPAQFYNWVEVKTKMWAMNLGKPMKVPQLNEAMAIELGANLLGEFIIFSIGAGLLIFEYRRQSNKEANKEEQILQEKLALQAAFDDMAFRIEKQDVQLRELRRLIYSLDNKAWVSRKLDPKREPEVLKELEEPHPHDRIKLFPDTPPASPSDQSSETSVKASPSPSSSNTSTPDLKQTHSEMKQNTNAKVESSRKL